MPIKLKQSESVPSNLPLNQYLIDLYENPATEDEYDALASNLFDQERDYAHGLIQDVLILVVVKSSDDSDLVKLLLKHLRVSIDMIDDLLAIVPTALLIVNPNLSEQQTYMLNCVSVSHHPENMITLLSRTDIVPELRNANILINENTIFDDIIDLEQATPLISSIINDSHLLLRINIPVATWSQLINLPADTRLMMSTTAQHQTYLQEREREQLKLLSLLARAC